MNRRAAFTVALLFCALGFTSSAEAVNVTGSGTTNFIPKWSGTTSLTNSTVFQYTDSLGDGQYIGIRTTKPYGQLGFRSSAAYEIFGADSSNHFNIASGGPMHLQPGVNRLGGIDNSQAFLGLGAGGLADLVVLESKKFTFTSGVGVGLGTSPDTDFATGYRLKVNGKIRAKEVKVETNWSDFVFAPDYKLMPLGELERSIQAQGHLPGIPSAQEVGRDGVAVGEMESRLLQKVEELTLYVIQLSKENQALRARLSAAGK